MRGVVDGLSSGVPLAEQLPAVYQEDEFTQRLCDAFDAALAPILLTLDCLVSYVTPEVAPDDFVSMLGDWLGVGLDDDIGDDAGRRALVAHAVAIHRMRGTAGGIRAAVRLATDAEVDITESGGTSWSTTPNSALPGTSGASVRVSVHAADETTVNRATIETIVAAVKPAHVRSEVTIGAAGGAS